MSFNSIGADVKRVRVVEKTGERRIREWHNPTVRKVGEIKMNIVPRGFSGNGHEPCCEWLGVAQTDCAEVEKKSS